jgi:hypothetical protein
MRDDPKVPPFELTEEERIRPTHSDTTPAGVTRYIKRRRNRKREHVLRARKEGPGR